MTIATLRQRILTTLTTSAVASVACGGDGAATSGRDDDASATAAAGASERGSGSGPGSSSEETPTRELGPRETLASDVSSTAKAAPHAGSSAGAETTSSTHEPTCLGQRKGRTCFEPHRIITKDSGYGRVRVPDTTPPIPPPPTRNSDGCVVAEEVIDGCCNPALSEPVLENGKCCYEFCKGVCCGRPLVVDGAERVALAASRRDWAAHTDGTDDGPLDGLGDLDPVTRRALGQAWTRDALREHASIASFAVFTLELLALGAPHDLVRDAQAAGTDEVEHARLSFSIASRLAGRAVGPGPLDVSDGRRRAGEARLAPRSGAAPTADLARIAAACVRDGCVNETIAAGLAAAQAAAATDRCARAALARIAEDEARHAELAWRFVRWALTVGGDDVRAAVTRAFDAPTPTAATVPDGIDHERWRAHGRLSSAEEQALVAELLAQVVAPCRAEVLSLPRGVEAEPRRPPQRSPG